MVSKTIVGKLTVGSNPTPSANVMSRDMEDGLNPQLGLGRFFLGGVGPLGLPVGW